MERKKRGILFFPATLMALIGICLVARHHPAIAVACSGLTTALFMNMDSRTHRIIPLLFALVTLAWILITGGFHWTFMVIAPGVILGWYLSRHPRHNWDSDDQFYLPALIVFVGMGILFVIRRYLFHYGESILELSGLPWIMDQLDQVMREGSQQFSGETAKEYEDMMRGFIEKFPYYYPGLQITLYTLVMNIILRLQKPVHIRTQPLLFFKIKERYVFLLIFSMGIEIFRYLLDQTVILYVSRSFFMFLGTSYFIAGLAVVGYMFVMRHLRPQKMLSQWLFFVLLFLIIIKPIICVAIGLLDIWFDFRRVKIIKGGLNQ